MLSIEALMEDYPVSYDLFTGGGGGGWGSAWGGGDSWNDVPDPEFGWGDARDQDGDPTTSSTDWRRVFGAAQSPLGGSSNAMARTPQSQAPQGMGALQGMPPEYILPLLNMYVESPPHVPLHSGYGQRWG